ncbi:MAG: amino acid--tRNA ligase-related protein, partial [Patescibacteria group bacterium]
MNERTLIADLAGKAGETVTIQGWVDVRRDQGKLVFFDFRDRTGTVQGVVLPGDEALTAIAKETRHEFVVAVDGIVNMRPPKNVQAGKLNGDIELEIKGIAVIAASETLPFEFDADLNLDTLFDNRPLTLRRKREQAIFRVQHEIVQAYRNFLTKEGFMEFQSPKLVGDDAEGGAGIFKVDYFNKTAYLATSPQLYKQILVGAFERVFTVGSMFRAEKHSTSRHMNELAMCDLEMGFIKDHTDVMRMITRLLRSITLHLEDSSASEFGALDASLPFVGDCDWFPVMKLREAQELIKRETG